MNNSELYQSIVIKAVGQIQRGNAESIFDCIVDICEIQDEYFDFKDFALWMKQYNGLISSIESDIRQKKMMKNYDSIFNTISVEEFF